MSRCFPFQPRGYEKKQVTSRPEDSDLLKEEKRKEKKHKKEKKDKEKREGKEKSDKDRSDGKHREKKEKKDKHRDKKDKKKDKEKEDKDKEKSSISEEARVSFVSGASSGGELHQRDEHKDRQNSSEKGRDEHKDTHISSEKGKHPNQFHVQHGERPFKISPFAVEAEDSKFVQELGRRIRDEEKGAQSQLPERFPVDWKRDEKTGRVGIKDSGNLAADKEKNKEKGVRNNKMDVQAFRSDLKFGADAISPNLSTVAKIKFEGIPRSLGENIEKTREEKQKSEERRGDAQALRSELKINAIPPNLSTVAKIKFEGIPRPREENIEKTREEKQKSKERRDDKPKEKNKDKEREKQNHGKQKDKEKEKKKEEKAKAKSEHKKRKEDKSSDTNKNDFVGFSNNKLPLVSTENIAGTVTEGIVRKRKDIESNGFLHESEVSPAKLPRPSSSQQPTQNGLKLDTHPKTDLFSSNEQGVATDIKVQIKEHGLNGCIEGKSSSSTKAKASSIIPGANQVTEASKRPPHPDSKYLRQILSVPKLDEWSGFDDQQWLMGSERTPAKKAKTCPDEVNKEQCVWSEALQIDSVDVCALPYVIPY